jgi:DHA1 family bicyclomycin/chloramphenicol resistance-like MFS transporter
MLQHHSTGSGNRPSDVHLMIVLGAIMAFTSISTDMYLPAMPKLAVDFGASPADVQMTVSAFLIAFSLGRLLWGPIGDRYGRRVPIAAGVVLFIIGSVGCALSTSVGQMLAWRVVQSLGACAGSVLARAMMSDLYTRERLSRGLSTLMLVSAIAPLVGPILGGQILAYLSWQAIFWVIAVFGGASLIGILSLPETYPQSQRIKEPFAVTVASYGQLLLKRRLMAFAISGGFFYAGTYAYIAATPFAYIEFHHVPSQAYGLLFGVNIVGMMAVNMVGRRLVMRVGTERMLMFGGAVATLAGLSLAFTAGTGMGGVLGLALPSLLMCRYPALSSPTRSRAPWCCLRSGRALGRPWSAPSTSAWECSAPRRSAGSRMGRPGPWAGSWGYPASAAWPLLRRSRGLDPACASLRQAVPGPPDATPRSDRPLSKSYAVYGHCPPHPAVALTRQVYRAAVDPNLGVLARRDQGAGRDEAAFARRQTGPQPQVAEQRVRGELLEPWRDRANRLRNPGGST